jgi:hypothetical protein
MSEFWLGGMTLRKAFVFYYRLARRRDHRDIVASTGWGLYCAWGWRKGLL